jgi:hypothetical protein
VRFTFIASMVEERRNTFSKPKPQRSRGKCAYYL